MQARMEETRALFRDAESTQFVIVTIPTAMAAAESARLAKALLQQQVGLPRLPNAASHSSWAGWLHGSTAWPAPGPWGGTGPSRRLMGTTALVEASPGRWQRTLAGHSRGWQWAPAAGCFCWQVAACCCRCMSCSCAVWQTWSGNTWQAPGHARRAGTGGLQTGAAARRCPCA